MDIQKAAKKKQKPINKLLPELLRHKLIYFRTEKNISRVELGEMADVSYHLIGSIEEGTIKNIGMKKLIQICNVVGFTLELELKPVN